MRRFITVLAAAAVAATGCNGGRAPSATPTRAASVPTHPTASPSAQAAIAPTVVAAGDISCRGCHDGATARLARNLRPRLVLALGDEQYPRGSYADFRASYADTWGQLKSRTRPVPGNHEYMTRGGAGYYRYFGVAAGLPSRGYYSYSIGGWHLVALNSNCVAVGGCGVGSPQSRWLRADLAAHRARCTLAYWHEPRYSSGLHGSNAAYSAFWVNLNLANADVALAGHDHGYERFAPLGAYGRVNRPDGVRSFVVGTGGAPHYSVRHVVTGSMRRDYRHWGVLRLTLRATGYSWRFVGIGGRTLDAGTQSCH